MGTRSGWRFLVVVALVASTAAAEPLGREAVPEPLAPWVDWVLRGHESAACPFLDGAAERRVCAWPARLDLALAGRRGEFRQQWLVHHESWVPLPGEGRRFPQEVRVDGRPAAVVLRAGRPSVQLEAGRHAVTGVFLWDALPELLQIPAETGIVRLALEGREVPFPNHDGKGRLWLRKRDDDGDAREQHLELRVHRRIVDEVPLLLETRAELNVAGRSREVILGRALPEGFVPLRLSSALPARLDPDGQLRVQVRAGRWPIALDARHVGPAAAISLPEPEGPWDASEEWVFEARPELRLVDVEGGVAIDPTQTTLPDAWRHLPAFQMQPGQTLRLVEKRRGDSDPAPDQLALRRVLWLDFDGGGYTVTDAIDGVVRRSTRLEMAPGTLLGRVAIDERDQLITRLGDSAQSGVEVSRGALHLVADSRVEAPSSVRASLPAVGWSHDFQSLAGQLHLPPGWRLLHASGVDRASTTWIERWTLLDLFAVLILAAVFLRLYGPGWGALALVALVLAWTEPGAPRWAWFAPLAADALLRVLPQVRFPRFTRGVALARGATLLLLVLIAIPFAVAQVRAGLFPTLERPQVSGVAPQLAEEETSEDYLQSASELEGRLDQAAKSVRPASPSAPKLQAYRRRYEPDPTARITTGPGLPRWQWTSVQLAWSGPVQRDQTLRLLLAPPALNRVLAFARVALVAALLWCMLGAARHGAARLLRAGSAALLVLVALAAPGGARADLPSPQLLEELRQRLLEPPSCLPHCASVPRLSLDVAPRALRIRIEAGASESTALALPGGARSWSPERVLLDGEPAAGLLRTEDGALWLALPAGRHEIVAEGPLPERDSIELPLPLRPHRVEVRASGWTVHGVHEDGVAEPNLQLARIRPDGDDGARTLEPGELPPFVRVERLLRLDLDWQTMTSVVRLSPADSALVLEVPLLGGESVTTPGLRAENGRVLVTMGPGVSRVDWTSLLAHTPELVLEAPAEPDRTELWRIDASPVWHVDAEGIPPVHEPSPEGARVRQWRPWPRETLRVRVERPSGVGGATATIDASRLELAPGLRATDATLGLTLRSSRGGPHSVTLPEGAELQRVAIDGVEQPIRQEERQVRLPLRPGRQEVALAWREPRGARTFLYRGSEVDLGMPSVNAEVHVKPSAGRWLLWTAGPRLGPAVLFWPLLAVFAALAFALGRFSDATGWTPLRFHHWLLLGVGLSQVPVPAAAGVVAWFLALGWRERHGTQVPGRWFDLLQLALLGFTGMALLVLFLAIRQGLLGAPEMQIAGNGSYGALLRWYQDRAGNALPRPGLLSVPLWVYRAAMLAWALWLALMLVRWLRWAWGCFSAGELWRDLRRPHLAPRSPEG